MLFYCIRVRENRFWATIFFHNISNFWLKCRLALIACHNDACSVHLCPIRRCFVRSSHILLCVNVWLYWYKWLQTTRINHISVMAAFLLCFLCVQYNDNNKFIFAGTTYRTHNTVPYSTQHITHKHIYLFWWNELWGNIWEIPYILSSYSSKLEFNWNISGDTRCSVFSMRLFNVWECNAEYIG